MPLCKSHLGPFEITFYLFRLSASWPASLTLQNQIKTKLRCKLYTKKLWLKAKKQSKAVSESSKEVQKMFYGLWVKGKKGKN